MPSHAAESAYDFEFSSIEGGALPLAGFKGKPLLVVNTASFCGFTPQYEGLQALWSRYRDKGLVVIGVPSNDFGAQEPKAEAEIKEFCEVNYDVGFPLTRKQVVEGESAHPFYRWAAAVGGEAAKPKWNFHKLLIAPDGSLAAAFPSKTEPLSPELTGAIEGLLKE
ncbi:MAG: glutathione peroxidase [Alphaproteobacteria bacterium]